MPTNPPVRPSLRRPPAIRSTVSYGQTPMNAEALFDLLDSVHDDLVRERAQLAAAKPSGQPQPNEVAQS